MRKKIEVRGEDLEVLFLMATWSMVLLFMAFGIFVSGNSRSCTVYGLQHTACAELRSLEKGNGSV